MSNSNYEEKFSSQTNAELEAQKLAQDNEIRELDLILKREQVSKIRQAAQQRMDQAESMKRSIEQFLLQRKLRQQKCNHRKGGSGAQAVLQGQGQSNMYAVIKHQMPTGKFLILCQRCGKEWHPALTALENGGTKQDATKGYYEALQFPTNNSQSGSSSFIFRAASEVAVEETESDE